MGLVRHGVHLTRPPGFCFCFFVFLLFFPFLLPSVFIILLVSLVFFFIPSSSSSFGLRFFLSVFVFLSLFGWNHFPTRWSHSLFVCFLQGGSIFPGPQMGMGQNRLVVFLLQGGSLCWPRRVQSMFPFARVTHFGYLCLTHVGRLIFFGGVCWLPYIMVTPCKGPFDSRGYGSKLTCCSVRNNLPSPGLGNEPVMIESFSFPFIHFLEPNRWCGLPGGFPFAPCKNQVSNPPTTQ